MEWLVLIECREGRSCYAFVTAADFGGEQRRAGRREAGHVYDSGRVTLATHSIFSKKFDIGHGHQPSPRNCGLLEDPTMKPSSLHDHSHSDSCRSSEAPQNDP